MEISRTVAVQPDVLIQIIDDVLPEHQGYATNNSNHTRIMLADDAILSLQAKAQDILLNYDELTVTASTTTMTEGDADPVVTCNDADILTDVTVGYIVLLDGVVYATGTDTVVTWDRDWETVHHHLVYLFDLKRL